MRSISQFGLSQVTVIFEDDVDIYFARQLVLERLQSAKEQLPPNISPPEMGPISVQIALDGNAARVDFLADAAATRQVIEQALPTLASSLRESVLYE